MSMRLVIACSNLGAGGAERVTCELANALAAEGHTVAVLTLSDPKTDHYVLAPSVHRLALNVIWDSHTVLQSVTGNVRRNRMIRRAVRQFEPHAVISLIEQTNVRVLSSLLGTRIPVIVSERIDPRRYIVGKSWRVARRALYPFADRLVVQTRRVADEWAVRVVPKRRVAVIPNFVRDLPDAPEFASRDARILLAVGRLDKQKGFDALLRAFSSSSLPNKAVKLVILGEGSERQALQQLAADLRIAEFVAMPGVVPDPETWMARCTVFVQSSRYEGFPNALLEAMAMGCPVVATDCDSGPQELVSDGADGLLVPVDDADAMARALDRLFDDEPLRRQFSAAARAVRSRYSKARIMSEWYSLIEDVLGGGRARRCVTHAASNE
jgi:GalNAc-alpha-(1->4)-GalNAc-alpha-(1->3)-diNAcBac-PP-undecaprenol alpha-1,4-N-acetyl-D-galactosaminyltransferase